MINNWLKAGILEDGLLRHATEGRFIGLTEVSGSVGIIDVGQSGQLMQTGDDPGRSLLGLHRRKTMQAWATSVPVVRKDHTNPISCSN
jgi:hypothetical protein